MKEYINHTGGCVGADMSWETQGIEYGIYSISYSYRNHHQSGRNQYIMTVDELMEGWENVQKAGQSLKRNLKTIEYNPYVKNLLSRNWFQVKHSDAIFAIGTFVNSKLTEVSGGTGWAVQMGIDNNKPVYVFDQEMNSWFMYLYSECKFTKCYSIPKLTENFAGIGTRGLNIFGKQAIEEIYKHNFKK